MKLLFLYGSPAVGKLTVAREIAARTRFKVFHNHLTIDAIKPVFDFGTDSFGKLVSLIRLATIEEAAREKVDLIYTFCYAKDADDEHVEKVVKAVEANGGKVCFVLLKAARAALRKRVAQESRQKMEKVKTAEMLDFLNAKYDLTSPVPNRESLVIDNTNLPAETVARRIIEHFNLPEKAKPS